MYSAKGLEPRDAERLDVLRAVFFHAVFEIGELPPDDARRRVLGLHALSELGEIDVSLGLDRGRAAIEQRFPAAERSGASLRIPLDDPQFHRAIVSFEDSAAGHLRWITLSPHREKEPYLAPARPCLTAAFGAPRVEVTSHAEGTATHSWAPAGDRVRLSAGRTSFSLVYEAAVTQADHRRWIDALARCDRKVEGGG
jgi:hypothetical protein